MQYDAALAFKAQWKGTADEQRAANAKALVEEYLPDGAAHQINIPSACFQKTMA